MAFTDWTFYNLGFGGCDVVTRVMGVIVNTTHHNGNAIEGTTFPYLSWAYTGGLQKINTVTSLYGLGLQAGRIFLSLNTDPDVSDGVPQNFGPMNFGVTCLQSQTQLTGGTGTCYALMFDSVNFAYNVKLCKMTAGIDYSIGGAFASTYILLGQTLNNIWAPGTQATLQLDWVSDPYFLRGTWLTAYVDSLQVFNIVHTGADAIATTTSAGEGIYAAGMANTGAVKIYQTQVLPRTLTAVNGVSYPPL